MCFDYIKFVLIYVVEYCERYVKVEDIGRYLEDFSDDELSEEEDCMFSDEEMVGYVDF